MMKSEGFEILLSAMTEVSIKLNRIGFTVEPAPPDPEVCLGRHIALDRVINIAIQTAEYMQQMESEIPLTANGLEGDFWLLAAFNGIVLADHPPQNNVHIIPKLM